MPRYDLVDAQQALGFVINQASFIEAEVYRQQFPEIQYPMLIPVDSSAPEWTKSVTFFSTSQIGQAEWFHHMATDMRMADIDRAKHEVGIEMAGIGYRYTLEEIGQAMMMNVPLSSERGMSAFRAYEEFVERVAIVGDTDKGWTGITNNALVTIINAPNGASPVDTEWIGKTGDEIAADINLILTGIYTSTNTVEMANTLLLPVVQMSQLATKRMSSQTSESVLEWISKYNVYTAMTGQKLLIRSLRQLATAGAGGTARAVAYRRDPQIIKMHIPMPHRFLPVWQTGPITFDIPGIFRLGGVEIRRPGAVRYLDLI